MSRIRSNFMWLTASQIATWSGSLMLLVVVPRHLDVADYGEWQFALTFVGYFILIGMLGTNTYLVKAVARDASSVGPYVINALVMKLVLTGLLSAFAIGLAHVLGYSSQTVLLVEVGCVLMVIMVLNDAIGAALQGLQRMGNFALWRVVQSVVGCTIVLAVLRSGRGIVVFALAAPIGAAIPLVANAIHLWPELRHSLRIDLKVWSRLIRGGVPFLVWSAIIVVYGTIDIPLLRAMAGESAVAWYALAYTWISMPAGFSTLVVTATMPSLSANGAHESSSAEFSRLANRGICVVAFLGIPASIGLVLIASDLFDLLHYQAGFEHAVPLVQILALHIPIVGIDMVLGSALIAVDRQKAWTLIACGAALLNPLINLIAIPMTMRAYGNGAIGAAIVTVGTEIFMMIGALLLRPKGVMDRPTVSFLARCTIASLVMVPALFAVWSAVLPVKVVVGMVTFALASVALGIISLDRLRSGFSGRFAPSHLLDTIAVPSK